MPRHGKKFRAALEKVDPLKMYAPADGVRLVKDAAFAKFDESVELHIRTGLDPRHADQVVRGSAVLPAGTRRTQPVGAFPPGGKAREIKGGRVEFRLDKTGVIHVPIGKVSFDEDKILQNLSALVDAVVRAKPTGAKGQYIRTLNLASTMGPGIGLDLQPTLALASTET